MLCTTTSILLVLLVTIVYCYLKRFYIAVDDRIQQIPGLRPQWPFGNLRNTGITTGRIPFHEALANLKEKYGDVYSFWFGPHYGIVLSRIEHVRYVLADRKKYDQSEMTSSAFSALAPTGLISLRGDDWKRHTRLIRPMFRRAKAISHFDTIVTYADRWIDERFVANSDQIHTDLIEQCQHLLLSIIAHVAFDYDQKKSSVDGFSLHEAFNDFVHYGNQFILMAGIPKWLGKVILLMHLKFRRALRIVKHHIMNIIAEEQKRQQNSSVKSTQPKSLIASLVAAVKKETTTLAEPALTLNELFDEICLSIFAGYELTSTAVSWFIFYMSKYGHIQQKIKAELKEHHLTHDSPLSLETLETLVYVECVAKEVLRFAPISTGIVRQAMQDDVIDNIQVSKGDNIMIATQNLHRDPRYWNVDPTKFVPERFLDDDKYPPQCAYMPFGGGHRACVGQDLAFLQLRTIIARLMQRVTFEDPGDEANNSGGWTQRLTCFPKHLAVRVRIYSDRTTA